MKKAELDHPGGKVSSADFEDENGTPAYSLELQTEEGEIEVTIDAMTGKVFTSDAD